MNPAKAPRRARAEFALGHVPVPVEHRGPDTTVYTEDNGIHYIIDRDERDAWLSYDGPISEVVL